MYAIAPNCDAAIFAAGHAGNGAFWLNPNTGKWSDNPRRISLVGKSIQRPPGCRFPYRRHDMGTGFPAGMYTFLPDWRDIAKYKFDDDRNNKFWTVHRQSSER